MKIKGLDLSRQFFLTLVKPMLNKQFPNLSYAAGLIGEGSEVLGYDDDISTDHHWGPRIQLFLKQQDFDIYKSDISQYFSENLPTEFLGFSLNWTQPDPGNSNNQFLKQGSQGKINHRIEIYTILSILKHLLWIDSPQIEISTWCSLSEHHLLEFTAGEIFYDSWGELTQIREKMHYFPFEVQIMKMIAIWQEIAELMPLMGRAGSSSDEFGSQLIGNKITNECIKICFIFQKRYYPYPKWFGRAFSELSYATTLIPKIQNAFYAQTWQKREEVICDLLVEIGRIFNQLAIIPPINFVKTQFYGRSYQFIAIGNLIDQLKQKIPVKLRRKIKVFGTINEFIENASALDSLEFQSAAKKLFEGI